MPEQATAPEISILHFYPTSHPAAWIINLAKRLRNDGIDAKLDVWDLKLGQDIPSYKEKAIFAPSIKHVLLIFDAAYFDKVVQGNAQKQLEIQLTRNELYKDLEQTKLIPLLRQREGDTKGYLPPAIQSRHCLSFSKDKDEEAYKQLRAAIYASSNPSFSTKPPLGHSKKPSKAYFSAASYLEIILEQPTRINQQSQLFFKAFLSVLKRGEGVYQFLCKAWREFLEEVSVKDLEPSFNTTSLVKTLEELGQMVQKEEVDVGLPLVIHELFLTAIVIGFQARNFSFLGNLLQRHYANPKITSFILFNCWKGTELELLQPATAGVVSQTLYEGLTPYYTVEQIVEADLICYYIAQMQSQTWVPFLACYITDQTYPVCWLDRLSFKKFFQETKCLYKVATEKEFSSAMTNAYIHQFRQPLHLYPAVLPLDEVVPRRVDILEDE